MGTHARSWVCKGVLTAGLAALVAAGVAGPTTSAGAATPQQWQLTPPGGQPVTATVALDASGRLTLSVRHGANVVLQPSALGIRTTAADLGTGLRFTGRADTHVTQQYQTKAGRRLAHTVDANETTLHFAKGSRRLDVVFRVSADGLGYRYVLPQSGQVKVTGEASEFAVPTSAKAYLLPYDNGRNDYESIQVHTTVAQAAAVAYGFPSLFRVGNSWLLLTESDMTGNYGAARLTLNSGNRRFRLTLPDAQETANGPLRTPWRTLVVGDLATVTESDLVTDLASPSKVADTSWIKAGRSGWSWWFDGTTSRSLDAQKREADYASKVGWEYILVDAGWSASWIPDLVAYAKQRHVGVWIWVHWTGLDTAAERDTKLAQYQSWGVAGLKIDFMQSDTQARMKWYDAILAASAQHRLMLDFHGATIPRGTERTWPQLMTTEAVRGAEAIHNKPGRLAFPLNYYTTLPFTRNLAGSMDYTPVSFTAKRDNTDAAELALSVVFESGLQNFPDGVDVYAGYPLAERFLRQVPAAWDDTKLLSGDPDTQAVLARRHGADWFVGAVTAGAARTVTAPLGFLASGDWLADIYADGPDRKIALRTQRVTAGGTLSVPVAAGGGFAVQLCPAAAGATTCG
jgi:hypothetical protein